MSCDHSQTLHAWHDGQLPAHQCTAFQQHLAACPQCQQELKEIAALSRLFANVKKPSISPDALRQLHQSSGMLRGRTIIRIATRLTAAASILLAIGLFSLWHQAPTPSQPVALWESMMVDWRTADTAASSDPETGNDHVEIALWLEAGPLQGGNHE